MTTPSIVPAPYQGNRKDYFNVPQDVEGDARSNQINVTIPASTASGTVVGLLPFRRGAQFVQGATQLRIADLDTSTNVTFDIGYVYDDNVTYTNDADAFASALTTAQTGGLITFDEFVGLNWVAQGQGWIVLTTGGGSTTTAGAIVGQIVMAYDNINMA